MQLSEIITGKAGPALEAPFMRVKFKVLGKDAQGVQILADAEADLVFVDEDERMAIRSETDAEMSKRFSGKDPPLSVESDDTSYRLLLRALRDTDDRRKQFCMGDVANLRRALSQRTAGELKATYDLFCVKEFPNHIEEDVFERLVESAKGKSLQDLLCSESSFTVLQAMPYLVAYFGSLPTETSGNGPRT